MHRYSMSKVNKTEKMIRITLKVHARQAVNEYTLKKIT